MTASAYGKRGVSATKDEVHAAIRNESRGEFPGAFCKLIPDACGDERYVCVMHADGAGTKSSLAYIVAKETGSVEPYRSLAQDSVVMNIDDLLCVGACDGFVLSNTIGRNAHRVGGDAIAAVISGYSEFCKFLGRWGVGVLMSGGETADVGDLCGTLIVDSTVFCRLPRANVVDCANICPGDVIVGLASSGRTAYERSYNSGIGSNGLTAARHLMLCHEYAARYPETFSATMGEENAYVGQYRIGDILPGTDITVGEALLSPTRTYAPLLKRLLERSHTSLHGIIHCTGGGQTKCLHFAEGLHYIKDNLFEMPPVFRAIAESGEISGSELYRDFNMGHRMEIYCPDSEAADIITSARDLGIEARVVGHVERAPYDSSVPANKNRLTISAGGQKYEYIG